MVGSKKVYRYGETGRVTHNQNIGNGTCDPPLQTAAVEPMETINGEIGDVGAGHILPIVSFTNL
jgi:hypothetical protein